MTESKMVGDGAGVLVADPPSPNLPAQSVPTHPAPPLRPQDLAWDTPLYVYRKFLPSRRSNSTKWLNCTAHVYAVYLDSMDLVIVYVPKIE